MSTKEIQQPTNPDIPKTKAEWVWLLWRVVPVFIFMGIVIWVLFAWVQDGRAEQNKRFSEQNKRIDKLEKLVEDCATAKKDRIEQGIDEILRRIPEK